MATSRQINASSLPAYMSKRVSMSGPNIGFPSVFCFGPWTFTGTIRPAVIKLPRAFRLIALGWAARSVSGAATLGFGQDPANDNTANAVTWGNAVIDLVASPQGVSYFNDTAATNYIVKSATNDPEVLIATNPYLKLAAAAGANTVTDLNVYIMGWFTEHLNLDKAND